MFPLPHKSHSGEQQEVSWIHHETLQREESFLVTFEVKYLGKLPIYFMLQSSSTKTKEWILRELSGPTCQSFESSRTVLLVFFIYHWLTFLPSRNVNLARNKEFWVCPVEPCPGRLVNNWEKNGEKKCKNHTSNIVTCYGCVEQGLHSNGVLSWHWPCAKRTLVLRKSFCPRSYLQNFSSFGEFSCL